MENKTKFDVAIIGDGPAALAAAVNVKIRKKSFILLGTPKGSHKVTVSPLINNYLGLPAISGTELMEKMADHAKQLDISWYEQRANQIYNMGSYFSVSDKNNNMFEAQAVIIASGINQNAKALPGETELLGRGVSYCATCDGLFYKNKVVAVLGENEEAVHDANYLVSIAKKVYYFPLKKIQGKLDDSIEVVMQRVDGIKGVDKVEGIVTNKETVAVDGVFLLRDIPNPDYLIPGIKLSESGAIAVDSSMRTNMPGVFAAGDITGLPYQLMKAVGQGQTAGLAAVTYIDGQY